MFYGSRISLLAFLIYNIFSFIMLFVWQTFYVFAKTV